MTQTASESNCTFLVIDPSEIFQLGLIKIIRSVFSKCNSLHARNSEEVETILSCEKPDIIIFELNIFSGTFINHTRIKFPKTKLIGYGNIKIGGVIKEFINLGLNAYLLKDDSKQEFINAIKKAIEGKTHFGQEFQNLINYNLLDGDKSIIYREFMSNDRYREILFLIYKEFTTKEIAIELNMSVKTVEGYRGKLLKLLAVNNMVGLAIYTEKHQLHLQKDLIERFNLKRQYIMPIAK